MQAGSSERTGHVADAARLELRLLGRAQVRIGGFEVERELRAKGVAMLAYLAVTGHAQPRASLAALLWGDMQESAARANLRVVLAALRRHLGERLRISGREIEFVPRPDDWLDTSILETSIRRSSTASPDECVALLEAAAGAYAGEFLVGLDVRNAPQFEDWRAHQADRLQSLAVSALLDLAERELTRGRPAAALDALHRVSRMQPTCETAYRLEMQLYARQGDVAAAEVAFEACRRALALELGVSPSPETLAVWDQVRSTCALATTQVVPAPPQPVYQPPAIERRQVSVLACELVDLTELAARLDVEELAAALRIQAERCASVIERWGGSFGRGLAGTWLGYFGYPKPVTDAAYRAVSAARELIDDRSLRAGIDTSLVVVEDGTPNLAGRAPISARELMRSAAPGTIVISQTVRQLVAEEFESSPSVQSRSGDAFELGARMPVAMRLNNRRRRRMVGRESELDGLRAAAMEAAEGCGAVWLVSGQPGIGKTRLLAELQRDVRQLVPEIAVLVCECEAAERTSPLAPVLDLIRQYVPDDTDLDLDVSDSAWLGPPQAAPIDQTIAMAAEWFGRLSQRRPVLLLIDDVQWADPSTLDLVETLATSAPTQPLLAVATAHPEFDMRPHWHDWIHLVQLDPLPEAAISELLSDVLDAYAAELPPEVKQAVLTRSGGVPLFAEELALAALEHHQQRRTGVVSPSAVLPTRLRELLDARIGRLGSAMRVAQVAATIGRRFSLELLATVMSTDASALEPELLQLVNARLIERAERPPRTSFVFSSGLLQEAAYERMPAEERREVHRCIAEVLRDRSDRADVRPEVLAQHMTLAGMEAAAINHWRRAATRAIQRSANREAVEHLHQALALLSRQPESAQRMYDELQLQTLLIVPLAATLGYSAAEVGAAYARAAELARSLDHVPAPILWGLASYYGHRACLDLAVTFVDQLVHMASDDVTGSLEVEARVAQAYFAHHRGSFAEARLHLEAGIAAYDPVRHAAHTVLYGVDPRIYCTATLGHDLWFQGYADQGLEQSQIAVALAEAQPHPVNLALALALETILRSFRGESQVVLELASRTRAICDAHALPHYAALVTPLEAAAALDVEAAEPGVQVRAMEHARAAVDEAVALGIELHRTHCLAVLGAICLRTGNLHEGLEAIDAALSLVKRGDQWYEAELWRLRAELAMAAGLPGEAAADAVARALFISRQQAPVRWSCAL